MQHKKVTAVVDEQACAELAAEVMKAMNAYLNEKKLLVFERSHADDANYLKEFCTTSWSHIVDKRISPAYGYTEMINEIQKIRSQLVDKNSESLLFKINYVLSNELSKTLNTDYDVSKEKEISIQFVNPKSPAKEFKK